MKLKFNLTRSDVELFRQIPKRTHHSHVIHAHPNSFTGKEAVIFMKNTFNVTDEEAEQLGNLLLQGNVIKALTYRTQPTFVGNSRSIYTTEDPEKEYLFWLQVEIPDPDDVSSFSESTRDSFEKGKNIPSMGTMVPFFGNALQVVSPTETNRSMQRLGREICRQHPEGVFRMNLVGHQYIVVCDPYHVQTIFESQCFGKQTHNDAIFKELRSFRGDGLTTVEDGTLHATCQGVIAPCLTKSRFLGYLPTIIATLQQTFADELDNRKKPVDMRYFWKKCTLRAVAKVAMSIDIYDDEEDWDRFSDGLTYVADEAINRVFKASKFVPIFNYKFKSEVRYMHKKMNSFIEKRREQHKLNPKDPKDYDLLDVMMFSSIGEENGRPVYMTSELIRANLTTILSAGHSTTTSMLSWTCNFLYDVSLGNTDYRYHLISEIDAVSGGDRTYVPTLDDVYKRMGFLTCVLKESLRLVPPIPSIVRHCVESTFLGDYPIQKGDTIMISALGTHLNKKSWGDNADEFNPYRFEKQPPLPCAFIPWAGGARQCIGREFALLVGRVALFTLLNQYSLEMAPEAHVKEDEHLFVFPSGLLMNVSKRRQLHGSSAKSVASPRGEQASSTNSMDSPSQVKIEKTVETWEGLKQLVRNAGHQVYILAGTQSECGNVNKVANWLVDKATTFNFKIGDGMMDPNDFLKIINDPEEETPEHVKAVSKIIAVVTATYQGKPAANTVEFFNWLAKKRAQLPEKPELAQSLSRYSFIVFGCGHSNWITTYQKVGKFIDETMELLGAKRIVPYYCFNEDSDDLEECFESFYKSMAPRLMHSLPQIGEQRLRQVNKGLFWQASRIQPQMQSSAIAMQVLGNAEDIGFPPVLPSAITSKNIQSCKIRNIKNITPNADRKTLHIEIELHESMKYTAGDHIVICPVMPLSLVQRVISQFVDTDGNTVVQWDNVFGGKPNRFHLPLGIPITVSNILTNLVDLKATPTKQFLMNMSTIVVNEEHATKLKHISDNQYREWVAENEPVSVVDVIEWFPVGSDRLDRLLEILPVTRPRQYSIATSPLMHPDVADVCIGVVEDTFPNQKVYQGVSSHYLSTLIGTTDSKVNAYIEPADPSFRVPADDTKPMILISAGTGFAPMRGFIQERYARKATGPIYCFFGCRNEDQDLLYAEELAQYQKEGFLTEWHVGYSRSSKYPSEYVQQKIEQRGEAVWQWLEAGAYIYICGSGSRVGTGSRDVIAKIIAQYGNTNPDEYIDKLTEDGRYELDVWG